MNRISHIRSLRRCLSSQTLSRRAVASDLLNHTQEPSLDVVALARAHRVSASKSMPRTSSWSSPTDNISRNMFSSSLAHLWTLFEACLESSDLNRAYTVLRGLESQAAPAELTVAVNNYLHKIAEANPADPDIAQKWLATLRVKLKGFTPNATTTAVILKNIYTSNDESRLQQYVKNIPPSELKKVSLQISILGIQAIRDITQMCNIPLSMIDEKMADTIATMEPVEAQKNFQKQIEANDLKSSTGQNSSLKLARNESISLNNILKENGELETESLEKKGVNSAIAVAADGLKIIRHSLGGLKIDLNQNSSPLLQNKDVGLETYLDFVKLWEDTPPELRAELEIELDRFNQARQRALETRSFQGAKEKWRLQVEGLKERGGIVDTKSLDYLLYKWAQDLIPLIELELERVNEVLKYSRPAEVPKPSKEDDFGSTKTVTVNDRFEYGPYIKLVKADKLAAITILELLKLNSTGGIVDGMKTARAVVSVGKAVEMEHRMQVNSRKEKNALKTSNTIHTSKSIDAVRDMIIKVDGDAYVAEWPVQIRARIGSLLISMLLHVAKVSVEGTDPKTGKKVKGKAPAFYHSYQYQGGSRLGVIKLHQVLGAYLSGERKASTLQPQLMPMLVKPRPWTSWNNGGYIYSSSRIMRSKDAPEQLAYLRTASERGQLDKVYEGLNVLGETAWTINGDVLKVALEVWNKGEEFLDLPPKQTETLQFPPAPPRDADPTVRRDYMRKCRELSNQYQAQYSQRCDSNYKIEIARAFLGERFYLPHNMDFRGRAYPLSAHLNHLGNDMSRGLLQFWEAKEIGEKGLQWIKIHMANLFGHNKMSFQEREAFVDDNMEKVIASAKDPLGCKWWQGAEDPWQCLAACFDLAKAYQLPDPTKHRSRLAVHQDGTCNGLQHYAALGGDIKGAKEVNLTPSDRPQDVYSRVLDDVKVLIDKDVELGVHEAKLVQGKLTRKVVKQTVMTNVYGVTFAGARTQISNKLKDIEGLNPDDVFLLSSYLASKVFQAVRSLFEGAHLIQDWLGECADMIAHSVRLDIDNAETSNKKVDYMSSVIWTTPLGMPIVQPYRQGAKNQIQTSMQSVFIIDPYAVRQVNARKQRTALPPNYIHSLDATHMLLSAIACGKKGITFASVHDSYWTHAGTVDEMNKLLRSAFIELHQSDLIAQLREEFITRYSSMLRIVPIAKDSDLAKKIVALRRNIALQNGKTSLSLQEQIELEKQRRNGKYTGATPVSLVEELSEAEFNALVEQSAQIRSKSTVSHVKKHTEHEGTGFDRFKDMDEGDDGTPMDETIAPAVKKNTGMIEILAPLRFPEVPAKGELDVNSLKESKYFFS